jgi:hypothetical protein
MAILTPSQLTSASNATYFDNATGSITPDAVRGLNTNWISSSILVSQTGSMSVATASFVVSASFAATASLLLGTVVSASSAISASYAISSSQAATASFYGGTVVSASYAATGSKVSILDDNGNNSHKVIFVNTAVATSGEQLLIDPTATQFTYNPNTNLLVVTASLASQAANATLFNSLSSSQFAQLVANNTFTGTNNFNIISASFANVVSASIEYLSVIYQTSSVIYSSGSNVFGDAAVDVQTLYGTVDIKTGPLLVTGSLNVTGSSTFSGSVNGQVISSSIASNTSSLNFGNANFFTSLVSGSTFFNITNPEPGETVNLLLTTVGVATASFSTNVKQVSGSAYTPTSGSGKNDVITFISFDGTSVYLANVKNLV